jgi:nucleoside-diphosphate-sugar epimerase
MTRSKRIAVAGGTGGIGSHIVEGLLEIKKRDSLYIIVLSRSSKPDVQFAGASAPVIGVDYKDVDAVAAILQEHQIDTIISTISGHSDFADIFEVTQQRLLDAALKVPSIHRFAPSEFAVHSERLVSAPLYQHKIPILRSLRKVKETRPNFEFTAFSVGIFMNYLGYGNPKPDGTKAHGHLQHFPYIVDLSKAAADVPGDGNIKFAWTTAEDVGRFTAAATQLEKWDEETNMAGEVITINEVINIAESITGEHQTRLQPPGSLSDGFAVQGRNLTSNTTLSRIF